MSRGRVGPRMRELCQVLARQGGKARSQSQAYLQLRYHGGASNYFGHQVMIRSFQKGLVRPQEGRQDLPGNRIPVELTPRGWEVSRGT